MAGFNYAAGCSNNMIEARERGMVNAGKWGRRFGVSAAAVVEVMQPHEAHHTGTGRRGRSRLTAVIDGSIEPTAAQLDAMRAYDAEARAKKAAAPREERGCDVRWLSWPTTRGARMIPTENVERGMDVLFFATGKIEGRKAGRAGYWPLEKKSGLVIARNGVVIHAARLNEQYDNADDIARRMSASSAAK